MILALNNSNIFIIPLLSRPMLSVWCMTLLWRILLKGYDTHCHTKMYKVAVKCMVSETTMFTSEPFFKVFYLTGVSNGLGMVRLS